MSPVPPRRTSRRAIRRTPRRWPGGTGRRPGPSRALAALLVGGALLSACSTAAESAVPADRATASTSAARSPSPSPSPSPPPLPPPPPAPEPPAVHPLTGAGPVPTGAVVAVKIDNSPLARPYHRGLGEAALVYQEVMEGGATRFFAVYAPAVASEVGPIRSIRESDLELITQFGTIALAASGANRGTLATVAQAEQAGALLDANYETVRGPYRKAERRRDAVNFYASPAAVDVARPGGTWPKDIGLRFGPLQAGGSPAGRVGVTFSKISDTAVQYDPATGRYAVFSEGDRLAGAAPANVVVQYVTVRDSPYVDVLGNRTPYTETVGGGGIVLLRDGVQLPGGWVRGSPAEGTRLVNAAGGDVLLKPGPTWFLLVPHGRALTVR